MFSCEFCKIFSNTYFEKHLWTAACDYQQVTLRRKCSYSELLWSAFLPHFRAFGLNTESPYSVRMRENAGKTRTRITPNTDTFCAVLVIDYFDINSFRNEFGQLQLLFEGNIGILVITESNIDPSFPTSQFKIEGSWSSYKFGQGC